MKKYSTLLLLICLLYNLQAQNNSTLYQLQDSLLQITKKLYKASNDEQKKMYNTQLLQTFEQAINEPNSLLFEFDSLKNDIGILLSPDKQFKIINWNIPWEDGTHSFYGFIQAKKIVRNKSGLFSKTKIETLEVFPLIDKSEEIKNQENYVGDNKRWIGMLFYKIIVKTYKHKNYFTLLAIDGNDKFTKKKIIDVLTFDNNGIPHFGADIFVMPKKFPKRVVFEYAASCTMSLRYNAKKDSIVFDHLAPTQSNFVGQYQYYCSDMSYDGFGFKKGKWNYGMDLNATNEKDEINKLYNNPKVKSKNRESNDLIIRQKRRKK